MTQASTALATISPAGAAVGMAGSYSMLRSWGFASTPVGLAVAVTGIWNQLANLTFPVVALALLTAADEDPALRTAAIVAVAILVVVLVSFALALSRPRRARIGGGPLASSAARRLVRRGPVSGCRELRAVPGPGARTPAPALARHHSGNSCRPPDGVRPPPRLPESRRRPGLRGLRCRGLRRLGVVRILGAMPLTPAGVGIVEIGLTGALVAFGASNAEAVTATLLYRALSVLPTLALGLLAAATWRTHDPQVDGGVSRPLVISGTTVRGRITGSGDDPPPIRARSERR